VRGGIAQGTDYTLSMDPETVRVIAMVCAGLGAASTVLYFVLKFRELRLVREIRDKRQE
jgi:hypothetical protein